MFDPAFPIIAQVVEADTVLCPIRLREEPGAEACEQGGIQPALEDGILNSLSMVFTDFRDAAQSSLSRGRLRIHVICHYNEHHSLSNLICRRNMDNRRCRHGDGAQ